MNKFVKFASILAASVVLAACVPDGANNASSGNSNRASSGNEFTILAGSELKDMEPILRKAEKDLGFPIKVTYTGTIDGVDRIKSGFEVDAAWFSQSKYFYDTEANSKRIKLSEKTMLSPVVVGVRESSWNSLGVKPNAVIDWKTVSSWVTKNKMTYAMTDPSESNTGYVALMGLAYANAGTGENLKVSDINKDVMKEFFKGHKINAGSSSWLMDAFKNSNVDFVINYESVIIQHNRNNPQDKLKIVYPNEGIVTADYPLLLIGKKNEQYKALAQYLKSEAVQTEVVQNTARRSIVPTVMSNQSVIDTSALLVEMPFTPDPAVSEDLLVAYFNDLKKPSAFVFVLDTSGSMNADREKRMKDAIASLTVNVDPSARFAKIRDREKVWIVPFSGQAYDNVYFDGNKQLAQINSYVSSLRMDGGTALFSSTMQAFNMLKKEMEKDNSYQYSVIVLTDGENTMGISAKDFARSVETSGVERGLIKVFPILFGNANKSELELIANSTGGRVFDGQSRPLNAVFKEIRGYQ